MEIDRRDFGALEADVRTLREEIKLLREDMALMRDTINQTKGGIWVVMAVAGTVGGAITLAIKRLFGG